MCSFFSTSRSLVTNDLITLYALSRAAMITSAKKVELLHFSLNPTANFSRTPCISRDVS